MIKLKDLAEEYLASFPIEMEQDNDDDDDFGHQEDKGETDKAFANKIKKGRLSFEDLEKMPEREKAYLTLTKVFPRGKKIKRELQREEEPVLDSYSWYDLSLIRGNAATPDKCLLNAMKRTKTAAGSAVMASHLINPHADVEEIKKKQAITEALGANEKAKEALGEEIDRVAENESTRLSFWKDKIVLRQPEYKKELDSFYFKRFGLASKNTSKWMLQFSKFFKDYCIHFGLLWALIGIVSVKILTLSSSNFREAGKEMYPDGLFKRIYLQNDIIIPGAGFFFAKDITFEGGLLAYTTNFERVKKIWRNQESTFVFKLFGTASSLFTVFIGLFLCYRAYKKFRKHQGTLNFLALHLIPCQDLILSARKVCRIIDGDERLKKLYKGKLAYTRALLAKADKKEGNAGELVHNLEVLNLRNRWYFFSFTGRMLATYKLLEEHKNVLADVIYELGEVDMTLGVQQLVEESKAYSSENNFIHGKLLESKKGSLPVLHMDKMWNTGIDAKEVVANDLHMNSAEGVRTLILTGPNAGGKSVYILGVGTNAVLHQAFGIVAAQSCEQTVFYKVVTYVNPTQSLAEGLSLAEAGMEVLRKHKGVLNSTDKPVLAIVDEILNGTDPKVAAEFSYKILKDRNSKYPNCLTLLTTHYMSIPSLADENKHVSNKKVVVNIPGSNGRAFDYTFKIKDGVSDQNIVGDMLQEKGLL